MKQWIIAAVLCLASPTAFGIDINAGISGSWYNPNRDGHGFAVEYFESAGGCSQGCLVVYWFTYTPEGDPLFLLGVGAVDGNEAEMDLFHYSGQTFGNFMPFPTEQRWGSLRLRFNTCDSGLAFYESDFESEQGTPYGEGSFQISRLASVSTLDCDRAERLKRMPGKPYSGIWAGNATSRDWQGDVVTSPGAGAIILDSGEAYLLWPEPSAYRGTLTGNGVNVSGDLTAYAAFPDELRDGSQTGTSRIDVAGRATLTHIASRQGEGVAGDYLEGHFNGVGVEGDFRLRYLTATGRNTSVSDLAKCWDFAGNNALEAPPVRIANNGSFTLEFESPACTLDAVITDDLANWNVFRVTGQMSGCNFDGTYTGVLSLLDSVRAGDESLLWYTMDNGEVSFSGIASDRSDDQCE